MLFPQSRFTIPVVAAMVAALGSIVSTASANVISNGDFAVNAAAYTGSFGYDGAVGNPVAPSSWTGTAPANYGGLGINGPDTSVGEPFAPGPSNNVLPPASSTGSEDYAFLQGGLISTSAGGLSPAVLSQSFSTTPGQVYVVTFDAAQNGNDASQGHPDTFVQLQVQATDPQNNVLATANSFAGGGLTITATSWTRNTLDFTADATATTLTFSDAPNSAAGETVDFTNVDVSSVPEPAEFGLLAIGGGLGLLMLNKRRRLAC